MLSSAAAGEWLDLGADPFKLAEMTAWPFKRMVRAAVLRHLLVEEEWPVDAPGVRLRGLRISGKLDLEAATLRCPLQLECCYLDAAEPVNLEQAVARLVYMKGCTLAGLSGDNLTATGLSLAGSTLTGPVRLVGAHITGTLDCSGARLTIADKDGYALNANRIKVGGNVFLDEESTATGTVPKFTATGTVGLVGANITGSLHCTGAELTIADKDGHAVNPDSTFALNADGIKVSGSVFLNEGFTATGTVRLGGADITGQLACNRAKLIGVAVDEDGDVRADKNGSALDADWMRVSLDVLFNDGFNASGTVSLISASVGAWVDLDSAKLAGVTALDATGTQITGTLRWAPTAPVSLGLSPVIGRP